MSMRYCGDCGEGHECGGAAAAADREVEIERLRTRRDIEVARITASAVKDVAETEAETGAAHAEGEAEGMREVLDAVTGAGEPAPTPPVVIDAGLVPEPDPDPDPDPVVEPPPVADPPRPHKGTPGWFDGYQ